MKKRTVALILAVTLVLGIAIGGTVAWLTTKTDPVTNTFTVGNIDIELTETEREYPLIPGNLLDKDPTVTVDGGSVDCWLFVKVEKSDNLDDFISYAIADGWTLLESGVYYREVSASANDQSFAVLAGNTVTVKSTVDKATLDALTDATRPTLTFTAYAVQRANFNSPADAWAEAIK